jgi:hypothetical protein
MEIVEFVLWTNDVFEWWMINYCCNGVLEW